MESPVADWYNTEQLKQQQNQLFFQRAFSESVRSLPTLQSKTVRQRHVNTTRPTNALARPQNPSAYIQSPRPRPTGTDSLVDSPQSVMTSSRSAFETLVAPALVRPPQFTVSNLPGRVQMGMTPASQPVATMHGTPPQTTGQPPAINHEYRGVTVLKLVHLARTVEKRQRLLGFALKLVADAEVCKEKN